MDLIKDEKGKSDKKKEIANILQSKFVKNLLNGLKNKTSYIKLQYVNFIKDSITIISEFLAPANLSETINEILKHYYSSLMELKPDSEEEEWNEDVNVFIIDLDERGKKKSHHIKKNATLNQTINQTIIMDKSSIYGNNTSLEKTKAQILNNEDENFLSKESKGKTNNNLFSESQQNQNQIFVILEAIKSTLNFYFKFYDVN